MISHSACLTVSIPGEVPEHCRVAEGAGIAIPAKGIVGHDADGRRERNERRVGETDVLARPVD